MKKFFFALMCLILPSACRATEVAAAPNPDDSSTTEEVPAAKKVKGSMREISVAELHKTKDQVRILVDVRTTGEFAGGYVPGAINIPMSEVDRRLSEFGEPGDEVHLVCRSGARSGTIAKKLKKLGYNTVNIQGGTMAWVRAGYPVEK